MTDKEVLKEALENYDYFMSEWREIREEGRIDMRYVSGDPWDPQEKKARQQAGRPCLALDELNQYLNQTINDVRQNKRAIKIVPVGAGANDQTAEFRGNLIRQIEYASNAQSAYSWAFQGAVERSYGAARIGARYVNGRDGEQELFIGRIPNPDSVLPDPDAQEADFSDMQACFVIDSFRVSRFKRRWPKAKIQDFTSDMRTNYPAWIKEDNIQVAEYWRMEEDGTACQYMLNAVEVLEKTPWKGSWIPILYVTGKEIYVDQGGGPKRLLMSMTRLARDPYMLYCYYRTCQAELVGMTPKIPWVGYEGQFENHEEEWANAHRTPIGFLQAKPIVDAATGNVLPLPQRANWEPPIQQLEMGAESAKRAIMSAMGKYNVSVGRNDSRVQSGVAIKALDTQADQGSYHFIDNYDRMIALAGRILDEQIRLRYAGPRELGIRKPDGSHQVVQTGTPFIDEQGQQQQIDLEKGEHDVTVSTGPSYQDEREIANDFVDVLVQNLATLPLPPEKLAELLSLAIKLKNMGPLGDQMAEIISPRQQGAIPPEAQAALKAMQAENQQLKQVVEALLQERKAKLLEIQSKLEVAQIQQETAIAVEGMKQNFAATTELLRQEMAAIEVRLTKLHESELAPDPAAGSLGLHPDKPEPVEGANGTPAPPTA